MSFYDDSIFYFFHDFDEEQDETCFYAPRPEHPPLRYIKDRYIITDTGGLGNATNVEELKFELDLLFFFLKIEFNGEESFDFHTANY